MGFALPPETSLVAEIGAGSAFEVAVVRWRGRESVARRLRPSLRGDPRGQCVLARHREALRRIAHPAVPVLLDSGSDESGAYLVESRAPGLSLAQLAAEHRRGRGPLPPTLLRRVAAAAFAALSELHDLDDVQGPLGFVHGDLCPDHLFVSPSPAEGVSFVDFGLARLRGVEPEPEARGTLPFIAPELARGEVAPSPATDAFALAASVAAAALGREPCRTAGPARWVEIAEQGLDLEALAELPAEGGTRGVLRDALRFEPERRVTDAGTLAERLRRS